MESEDYDFYKGLEFLVDNQVMIKSTENIFLFLYFLQVADLGYDLTFSTEIQEFGVTEVRDLINDGRNVIVSKLIEFLRIK